MVGHAIDLTKQNLITAGDQHGPAESASAARDPVKGLRQFGQGLDYLDRGAWCRSPGLVNGFRNEGPA